MGKTGRRRYGTGWGYTLDGKKADSVTWALKGGIPAPGLIGWASRVPAEFVADNAADLFKVGPGGDVEPRLGRAAFIDTVKNAANRDRDSAGVKGTKVHALAAKLAAGEEVEVPEELEGHLESYMAFVDAWAPEELFFETTMGNRRYRYMGTFDVLFELDAALAPVLKVKKPKGRPLRVLADYKTSRSGVFPDNAVQLNAYANGEFLLDANGEEIEVPEIDALAVIWLRADGHDVYPVEFGDRPWKQFLYALQTARMRDREHNEWIGEAVRPPAKGDK